MHIESNVLGISRPTFLSSAGNWMHMNNSNQFEYQNQHKMTHERNVTLRSEWEMLSVINESIFFKFWIRDVGNMKKIARYKHTIAYGWNFMCLKLSVASGTKFKAEGLLGQNIVHKILNMNRIIIKVWVSNLFGWRFDHHRWIENWKVRKGFWRTVQNWRKRENRLNNNSTNNGL